jgi:hypothetical protein
MGGRTQQTHGPVLVLLDPACGYTARSASWRERISAYLRADSLDRLLAQGVPPEADPVLFLHARRLASPRTRRQLARSVRRVLDNHEQPPLTAAPPRSARRRVHAARQLLVELADVLDSARPVQTHGVALTRVLLVDGCGPLYRADSPRDLVVELRRVIDVLIAV